MEDKSDQQLQDMFVRPAGTWSGEALAAARLELQKRNIQPGLVSTQETPASGEIFEIVTNVLTQPTGVAAEIYGDLFVTANRLIYSRLAFVNAPEGGLVGVSVDPVKGMARMAGLVDRGREVNEATKKAREAAVDARKRFWGRSIEARIRQGAVVVAKESVQTIKLHQGINGMGNIEVVLVDGEPFLMSVYGAEQVFERLQLWWRGKPVQVPGDRQGVDQNFPLPSELLQSIQDSSTSSSFDPVVCTRAANTDSYRQELVKELKKVPWPQRKLVAKMIQERFDSLTANRVGWAMTNDPWGRWAMAMGYSGVISLPLLLLAGMGISESKMGYDKVLMCFLIFTAAFICLSLTFFVLARQDRRRNMECAQILSEARPLPS